ncbi:HmuY family protein [Psychroflexus aestuariivivens]|uniref:HmuY family protein n=1 Tax=Psychroflexus aestuariivivens TaxID=1795040 RepID=UPI000FD9542B|nr:HmuY family protein [Psychroflexus aestuariivivens]
MKHLKITLQILLLVLFISCDSDDDNPAQSEMVVAFENASTSFSAEDDRKTINLVFSSPATENGSLIVDWNSTNSVYGEDFTVIPEATNNSFTLEFNAGDEGVSFDINKLQNPIEGTQKSVNFDIIEVNHRNAIVGGNTSLNVDFTGAAAASGNISPEVGGPNQPNQVYVDLSGQNSTAINRAAWDLAFYQGEEFRVKLNGSLFMATAELDETDITAITSQDVASLQGQVAVGTFNPSNMAYVDAPSGEINETAIAEIANNNEDNKVYLLNLGNSVGTETPQPGSVELSGEPRGWKKIRILKDGINYILQHADLDATEFEEISISKSGNNAFEYVNLASNSTVEVDQNIQWDIEFTTFTNEIEGAGSYGYSDFVVNNRLANVSAYAVENSEIEYADYNIEDVSDEEFSLDQRAIGSNWRVGGGPNSSPTLKQELFFVLKDSDENIYKIRFTALTDENGVRGFPKFEYEKLN